MKKIKKALGGTPTPPHAIRPQMTGEHPITPRPLSCRASYGREIHRVSRAYAYNIGKAVPKSKEN
jgi:hypothetical protein